MKASLIILLIGLVVFPFSVFGQGNERSEGIEIGSFVLQPGAEAVFAYDDRTVIDPAGRALDDFYGELGVSAQLNNSTARYGFSASGEYGERYYSDFSDLNDSFYTTRASLSSTQNPLQWGLSGSATKSLSYNTAGATSGNGGQGILTDETSRNYTGNADISYEKQLSDRTVLTPSVGATHYFQDFETTGDAEWQTYSAGCEIAYAHSPNTFITLYRRLQLSG